MVHRSAMGTSAKDGPSTQRACGFAGLGPEQPSGAVERWPVPDRTAADRRGCCQPHPRECRKTRAGAMTTARWASSICSDNVVDAGQNAFGVQPGLAGCWILRHMDSGTCDREGALGVNPNRAHCPHHAPPGAGAPNARRRRRDQLPER